MEWVGWPVGVGCGVPGIPLVGVSLQEEAYSFLSVWGMTRGMKRQACASEDADKWLWSTIGCMLGTCASTVQVGARERDGRIDWQAMPRVALRACCELEVEVKAGMRSRVKAQTHVWRATRFPL